MSRNDTFTTVSCKKQGGKKSSGSLPPPLSLGKPQSGFRVIVFVEMLHLTFSRQLWRLRAVTHTKPGRSDCSANWCRQEITERAS